VKEVEVRFRFRKKEESEPTIFDLATTPLVPIPLFKFKFPLHPFKEFPLGKEYLLRDLCPLNESEYHTPVAIGYQREGLGFQIHYSKSEFTCLPTNFKGGDAVELFIDTRDNKQANYPTKFCHHFLFYPEQVEGLYGKEITRFRGEETHDLASSTSFHVTKKEKRGQTTLEIFISKEALYGYDPEQFNRIGFTYRLHLEEHGTQLFSTSPQFSIEQNPSFFASLEMQ
jgi:hypothetical protein